MGVCSSITAMSLPLTVLLFHKFYAPGAEQSAILFKQFLFNLMLLVGPLVFKVSCVRHLKKII